MSEYDKMISGNWHYPEKENLPELRNAQRNRLLKFNNEEDDIERKLLLKDILGNIGVNCFVTPPFFCDYGINTTFGNNVYLNANCVILDSARVTIGDNTLLGPNVQIYTPFHPIDYKTRNTGVECAKPVHIGKNCWLGGSVIILPGVTIGDGCVIGAGAVITKDIPKNSIAVGNPAKVIKTINQ